MDENQEKRIFKKLLILVLIAIVVNWILFNYQSVKSFLDYAFLVLTPFTIGIFIALLLNIPMNFFSKKLRKKDKNGVLKERKILSMTLSIISVLCVVIFVIMLIVPELIKIGNIIIENMPYYEQSIAKGLNDMQGVIPELNAENIENTFVSNLEDIKKTLINQVPNMLTSSVGFIAGTFMAIINFFIGIGFAFLLLLDKENVKKQTKKFLYTYMKKERAEKIISFTGTFISAFSKFVVVQCITAVILGILCIISSFLLQIPYALQIGILLGFSSLVPIIGVFIGIIISCILIVSVSPIKAIIFAILAILLWQIEENFIKPKIIGKKVGLPELWIFVAMIIGISVFGFLGIFITVPIATAIYNVIKEKMDKTNVEEV